jgi:hypothetical protein
MSLTAEALLDVLQGILSDQGVQLARLQANYNKGQKKQRRPENEQGGQAGTGKKKSCSKHNAQSEPPNSAPALSVSNTPTEQEQSRVMETTL